MWLIFLDRVTYILYYSSWKSVLFACVLVKLWHVLPQFNQQRILNFVRKIFKATTIFVAFFIDSLRCVHHTSVDVHLPMLADKEFTLFKLSQQCNVTIMAVLSTPLHDKVTFTWFPLSLLANTGKKMHILSQGVWFSVLMTESKKSHWFLLRPRPSIMRQ